MKRRSLLFLAPVGIAATVPARAAPDLVIQAHFECLWWAEAEMEGLNPDRPPPKTTRVRIDRWEYSDPIGVPHPDEVILVLALRSARARRLSLAMRTKWRLRTWTAPETRPAQAVVLAADQPQIVEFTIPVAHMILDRNARHLAVEILADGRPVHQIALPVQGGD